MGEKTVEELLAQADALLADDKALPLDLMVKLQGAGIDTSRLKPISF